MSNLESNRDNNGRIQMVGRHNVEHSIYRLVEQAGSTSQVIFITGEGGIGKTSLMYAIRDTFSERPGYCVTRIGRELDCYDLEIHSKMRLAERLSEALPPDKARFSRYHDANRILIDRETSGDVKGAAESRAETLDIFAQELRQVAAKQRVIILMDTAERLVYFADQQGIVDDLIANSWQWLKEELLPISNITWIIAGRIQAERLFTNQKVLDKIFIEPLDRSGCADFLEVMSRRCRTVGRERDANILERLPEAFIDAAYSVTKGIPLRLSMLALLATMKPLGEDHPLLKELNNDNFDNAILAELMGPPAFGLILRTAGRLRKGFDERILTNALAEESIRDREIEQVLARLRLFGFIKQPRGGRRFLHDVLYTLLDNHVFSHLADKDEANNIYYQIHTDIVAREQQIKENLDELFVPVDDLRTNLFNDEQYKRLLQQRLQIMVERLYYQLQVDPQRGFRFYFRYSFEAISSGNPAQDVLLIAELLNFLGEQNIRKVDGLDRLDFGVVYGISLPRKIAQACAEGNYDTAIQAAEIAMQQYQRNPQQYGGTQTMAMIKTWYGYALTAMGREHFVHAERLLLDAVDQLKEQRLLFPSITTAAGFRACGGLAFATERLGFYYRTRGLHKQAADNYARAIRLGREVEVWINLADALSAQGLVQAQLGRLSDAKALIEEGEELRRRLSLPGLIASSQNARGVIERRRGNYAEAIQLHRQSRARFSVLQNRGGLRASLVNLTEALRRAGTRVNNDYQHRLTLVSEAYQCAQITLKLNDDNRSVILRVRELLEAGCAARDLIRLRISDPRNVEDIETITVDSANYLQQAADMAQGLNLARYIDALTNLAFLWWYVHQPGRAEQAIETARLAVPKEYLIDKAIGRPNIASINASADIWMHLAKQETLKGHLVADRLSLQQDQGKVSYNATNLYEMALYYTLSLEYNKLHSSDEIGSIGAVEQIFGRLENLQINDLDEFTEHVSKIEIDWNLAGTSHISRLQEIMKRRGLWRDEV